MRDSMDIRRPVMGAAGPAGDFDPLASEGLEELGGGGVVAHAEGEQFELLSERRGGVVVDSGRSGRRLRRGL